jgi:hypothetical protein
MQQHPIPQNVMTVEFQLVGNLTLRQFVYIGIGGVLDFTLFVFPIYGFIKWPLILIIAAFSTSLAYLPLNDIGLDRWVIAFFRAINSPTKRIWHREIKELPIFAKDYAKRFLHEDISPTTTDRSRLDSYLASLKQPEEKSELDIAEESFVKSLPFEAIGTPPLPPKTSETAQVPTTPTIKPLKEVNALEEKRTVEERITPATHIIPPATTPSKPIITVRMPDKNIYVKKVTTTTVNRVLHSLSSLQGTIVMPVRGEKTFEPSQQLREILTPEVSENPPNPAIQTPLPHEIPVLQPTPQYIEELKMPQPNPTPQPTATSVINFDQQLALETKLAQEAETARAKLAEKPPALMYTPTIPTQNTTPKKITTMPPPQKPQTPKEAPIPEMSKPLILTTNPEARKEEKIKPALPINQPEVIKAEETLIQATPAIGKMAPPPATIPNVIVGLIRAKEGLLLTDVVVVIKDTEGEPVRALKSNKVGQFAITTPLPNGTYHIDFNKDTYQFDTIKVTLNGQIFQPIEIRSK